MLDHASAPIYLHTAWRHTETGRTLNQISERQRDLGCQKVAKTVLQRAFGGIDYDYRIRELEFEAQRYDEDLEALSEITELTTQELQALDKEEVERLAAELISEQETIISTSRSIKSRIIAERARCNLRIAFRKFNISIPSV